MESKTRKIQIVEDQMIIAIDLQYMLEDLGYEICNISTSYDEAIRNIESVKPDLILLDILLQENKTGIDLAHEINRQHFIPFIFLTSHSDQTTVDAAKATNPRGYIVKPFTKHDLYEVLDHAFDPI